ncbi:hypothetical protein [Haloarchaeobius sp. TZWWS8]|uniref:hypothetical protein n=1 Tax=Haloarchaeobius sp. TZWWS8 TaxID=3446121 RepID=UPI003EBC3276
MASQWQGGVVRASTGAEPPEVESWEPVAVPGRPAQFAGADAVAYRLRFGDPRRTPAQRALLELQGVYGHARIWLDGTLLGTHDTYFQPAQFEFEPAAENELVVECRRPEDGFGGVYETDLVTPELAVPAIWWGAHLRLRPPTYLADLTVNPRLTDEGAVIDVAVCVDAGDAVDEAVTLSVRPEGFRGGAAMERERVVADPGERITVTRTLELHDPSYWWSRTHGDQHRYTVRAKFGDQERSVTTGVCDVSYDDGLWVNGRRVRVRGVNVLPGLDPLTDLEAAVDANCDLVRVHAHALPQAFYDAADEAGVLVWQDLPLSGPQTVDPERGRELARALSATYDHHPSIRLFGVHDDPADPFPERLGSGRVDRFRFGRRLSGTTVDRSAAEAIATGFPADAAVFPVCGQPGTTPDAAHLYPGWRYGDADGVSWLLAKHPEYGAVVSEFGAGSVTTAGASPPGLDRARHDAVVGSDDPDRSQATQARIVKRVAEALRVRGANVLAAFCLRDAGPGGGMGVVAADGTRKPAFDSLRTAYQPVVAIATESPPGSVPVTVVNDLSRVVEGTVTWTAGDAGESVSVVADPGERVDVGTASVPGGADRLELAVETDSFRAVNVYSL